MEPVMGTTQTYMMALLRPIEHSLWFLMYQKQVGLHVVIELIYRNNKNVWSLLQ